MKYLDDHIGYLRRHDAESRDALARQWASCGTAMAEINRDLSRYRRPTELGRHHDEESAKAARCAAVLPEIDFQTSPRRQATRHIALAYAIFINLE